ncbi:hypothetical protein [[Clostridium] innocuum]|jgi:hypothetical protein|uniref:hypothetical protein n=1 Tax=Clostridium innocuum TaxID=1522 RepID=UPI002147AC8F|nr:hypothetical protein [[Clostridium] innocuum]MCR0153961.1 hypothetical protein [[Clostridium] innocuum]MCR0163387.1 hypothetical protein [[Clostridium] innocuum]MCR0294051.1 hypothetical protein [[Clostridium] innocuum]MCR0555135.1 hypothetical protein [[Clostridium] innocuum]
MAINSGKRRPSVQDKRNASKTCEVPESSVFFNFQYITSDKRFNYEYIKKGKQSIYKDIVKALQKFSQNSWDELRRMGKDNGGFETMEYGRMVPSIADKIKDKPITKDTKLYIFRVGGNKYRMIGYKSNSCRAAMHILGFDFDFSLYDHGG